MTDVSVPFLEHDLIGAVGRGEIDSDYQPQIDLRTGAIVAVEVLSRWNHPELGLIPPSVFIPIAERTGLIHEIGRFMLDAGVRQAVDLRSAGWSIGVSVNVAAAQLAADGFIAHLIDRLAGHSLDPAAITLEITESQLIRDLSGVEARLSGLRELGLGISIDDFGTGHSSIAQLIGLNATELKIDRSLLQNPAPENHRLIAALVALVHERDVRVVAEGIETAEQLATSRRLGCDRGQGYLIARPMSAERLDEHIRQLKA